MRASVGGLDKVSQARQGMEAAAQIGDAFAENCAHQRFQIEVVALAGQHHLLSAFEPVILKLQLLIATNLRLEAEHRNWTEGVARHRRLLDEFGTGDLPAILLALERHGARTYTG